MKLTTTLLLSTLLLVVLFLLWITSTPSPTPIADAESREYIDRLLPRRGDRGETTQWASRSHFAKALDAGVRIALYQPGYLHSKLIVSDDRVGIVGSCNIDPRSYLLCQEVMAVVESPEYAKTLKAIFADDESQSLYINPDEWRQRPPTSKIKEALVRPLSSQL